MIIIRKALSIMNYNDKYRAGCQRAYTRADLRPSCSCEHHHPANDATNRFSSCGCRHDYPIKDASPKVPSCGCDTDINPSQKKHPGTTCTTVPVAEGCVDTYPMAMAYVPMQGWNELFDPATALTRGTIFRELDLPFYPINCRKDCK